MRPTSPSQLSTQYGADLSSDDSDVEDGGQKRQLQSKSAPKRKKQQRQQAAQQRRFIFDCEPSTVVFTDFEQGETYEQIVTLTNCSAESHQVRLSQPMPSVEGKRSSFAVVSLQQELPELAFGTCNALAIAPGMNCKYKIIFKPRNLGDVDEVVKVVTDNETFLLRLQARRTPPLLDLPKHLHCGYAFVGSSTSKVFRCTNRGGAGKYRFYMPGQIETYAFDELVHTEEAFDCAPFSVLPREFELQTGQSIDIEISYDASKVTDEGKEEMLLYLACDTLKSQSFNLMADAIYPRVRLCKIDQLEFDAQKHRSVLVFDEMYPGACQQKTVSFRNESQLPISYYWGVFWLDQDTGQPRLMDLEDMQPSSSNGGSRIGSSLRLGSSQRRNTKIVNIDETPRSSRGAVSSNGKPPLLPFRVDVPAGTIVGDAVQHFNISFTPHAASVKGDVFLILYINGVPHPIQENHPFHARVRDCGKQLATLAKVLRSASVSYDPLGFFSSSQNQLSEESLQLASRHQGFFCQAIRVYGAAKPFDLEIEPPALVFGRPITVNEHVARTLAIYNNSSAEVEFQWKSRSNSDWYQVRFEPEQGGIAPAGRADVSFIFAPFFLGDIDENFECVITGQDEPLILNIKASVTGPDVVIDAPALDFGVVEVGSISKIPLQITNVSNVGIQIQLYNKRVPLISEWQRASLASKPDGQRLIDEMDEEEEDIMALDPELFLTPNVETLEPRQRAVITVLLRPLTDHRINEVIECQVLHGATKFISVRGEARHVRVVCEPSLVDLGVLYVDNPVSFSFCLHNLGSIQCSYYWMIEEVLQSATAGELRFIADETSSPQSKGTQNTDEKDLEPHGMLGGGTTAYFSVSLLPKKPGKYEFVFPCAIQNRVDNPVGLVLRCEVRGFSAQVCIKELEAIQRPVIVGAEEEEEASSDAMPLTLDFGEVKLGRRKSLTLQARNLSDCIGFFALTFGTLGAPVNHSRRKQYSHVSFHRTSRPLGRGDSRKDLQSALSGSLTANSAPVSGRGTHRTSIPDQIDRDQLPFKSKGGKKLVQKREEQLAEKEFEKEVLASGAGVAFDADLLNGRLDGREVIEIRATCYSNKCGVYEDTLRLQFEGIPGEVIIPVRATVVGIPLELIGPTVGLQINAEEGSFAASLVYPPLCFHDVPMTKTVRVKNTSNVDLEVFWQIVDPRRPISVSLMSDEQSSRIKLQEFGENFVDQRIVEQELTTLQQRKHTRALKNAKDSHLFRVTPAQRTIRAGQTEQFQIILNPIVEGSIMITAKADFMVSQGQDDTGKELMRPLFMELRALSLAPQLEPNVPALKYVCSVNETIDSRSCTKRLHLQNKMQCTLAFTVSTGAPFVIKSAEGPEHPLSLVIARTPDIVSSRETLSSRSRLSSNRPNFDAVQKAALSTATSLLTGRAAEDDPSVATSSGSSSNSRATSAQGKPRIFVLQPLDEMTVDVSFLPTSQVFKIAEEEQSEESSVLSYEQKLVVRYLNSDERSIPLTATVHFPQLQLEHNNNNNNKKELNFGVVQSDVHSLKTLQLVISNKSRFAAAEWRIEQHEGEEEEQQGRDDVFFLDQITGICEPLGKTTVNITFKPVLNGLYESDYVVIVDNARKAQREACTFRLMGQFAGAEFSLLRQSMKQHHRRTTTVQL